MWVKISKYKHLVFAIMIVALLSLFANTSHAYTDVSESNWYHSYIEGFKDSGVIDGYLDGTFRPMNHVSLAEAIKMLTTLQAPDLQIRNNSEGHWADNYFQSALKNRLILEKIETNKYNKPLTRYEASELIINYINTKLNRNTHYFELRSYLNTDSYFADAFGLSADFLYESGIIKGVKEGKGIKFYPREEITRAEFTAIMSRTQEYLKKVEEEYKKEEIEYPSLTRWRDLDYKLETYVNNPLTSEELMRVSLYMMHYNLDSVTLHYSAENVNKVIRGGPFVTEYFKEMLNDAYKFTFGSKPEYFTGEWYKRQGAVLNEDGSGEITISFINGRIPIKETYEMRNDFEEETIKIAKELVDAGIIYEGLTQREIAIRIQDWLLNKVSYDYDLSDSSFIGMGVLSTNKAVCTGYTIVYNRLLSLFGIEAYGTEGMSYGYGHIWTEAILDGEKYYIDSTWNDSGYGRLRYFTTNPWVFKAERTWDEDFFNDHRYLIKYKEKER